MKTLDKYDFAGKKALMRVDFNVPLDKTYNVTDDTRIRAALPSMNKILADGGSIILMSHLGRPKNGAEEKYSLKHLIPYLKDALKRDIVFATDCVGEEAQAKAEALKPGDVLLLENLRFHKEETEGDSSFAKALARLGDVWVMDAFGTAHREHASTAVIGSYVDDKVAGYVMQAELDNAEKVMEEAQRPFTAIMGGAKISDKIEVIEKLLGKIDHLIIGGGMAYTFFKAMGGQIGSSLVEEDKLELARQLIKQAKAENVNIHLPIDSIIADKFDAEANTKICNNHAIPDGWMGLDIGPEARQIFADVVAKSKTILWNGPMGVFEMDKFAEGTRHIAKAVVRATHDGAFSLIGGGDSAAAVNQLGFGGDVSYVSTGGGALLEYFEGKELPGVSALQKNGIF